MVWPCGKNGGYRVGEEDSKDEDQREKKQRKTENIVVGRGGA